MERLKCLYDLASSLSLDVMSSDAIHPLHDSQKSTVNQAKQPTRHLYNSRACSKDSVRPTCPSALRLKTPLFKKICLIFTNSTTKMPPKSPAVGLDSETAKFRVKTIDELFPGRLEPE